MVIDYTVVGTDDEPAEEEDYTPRSGQLTISAGQRTGTIVIRAEDDDVLEPRESFKVTLKSGLPTDVVTVPEDTSADSTIGVSGRTVTASVTGTTVNEGERALFPVTLSGKVFGPVTVNYDVTSDAPDTAAATLDYKIPPNTIPPKTIVIEAGDTTGMITVDTVEDDVAEDNETFTVMLMLPGDSPISLGEATATGTINDDDRLTVTVEGPDRVAQGETAAYKVRLSGGKGGTVITVKYTQNGGEEQEAPITMNLTVADLTSILTGADPLPGKGDTLVVRLTSVSIAEGTVSLGSPREKHTTIVDAATITVSVEPDTAPQEPGSATFKVKRTAGTLSGTVTVPYQVVYGSASAADFEGPTSGTVVFPAGNAPSDREQPIKVSLKDDDLAEREETFSVRLSSPQRSDTTDKVVLGTTTATATVPANEGLTTRVTSRGHDGVGGPAGPVRGGSGWHQQRACGDRLHGR